MIDTAACTGCSRLGTVTSINGQLQPETVSTDYDTSDKLYFEPLTMEDDGNSDEEGVTGFYSAVWRADAKTAMPLYNQKVK